MDNSYRQLNKDFHILHVYFKIWAMRKYKYINDNGAYYGVKKIGDNMNFTDGLKRYMAKS